MDLSSQKCVPCQIGAPTLKGDELKKYFDSVLDWEGIEGDTKISKDFEFKNFSEALEFINKIAKLAESEGHHPDLRLHDFKFVEVILWTHKIGGLHQNDFILASKISKLVSSK